MRQILQYIAISLAGILTALGLVAMQTASVSAASPKEDVCAGVSQASGGTGGGCSGGGAELSQVVKAVVNIISIIAGVAGVIMLIIGGLRYITGGGDASSVASAKNTIIYAIVGLIVVALSQVIVRFVLGKASEGGS